MFEINPLARGLAAAFGGLACAMVVAMPAQAQAPAAPSAKLDRVEVTGSMIKRAEGETALPIQVLKMDDLQKAGVTTAEQALQFIAENQSAVVSSSSVGSSNGGAAYADLRGLGPQRTLVLLNGQRVVNNPYTALAVDLNTIPTIGIERIEVLRDGASAVYGTDAMAGVINIITRKEYQGIAVSAETKLPQASGGKSTSASVGGGYGSLNEHGWNLWAGFNYQKQDPVSSQQRGYASTGIVPEKGLYKVSGTTFPANYSGSLISDPSKTGSTNPSLGKGCASPLSVDLGDSVCYYDYTRQIQLVPEQERYSFMTKGTLALGANNTLSLEYFRTQNTLKSQVAPTPVVGLTMTSANAFFPGKGITPLGNTDIDLSQGTVGLRWRTLDAGQRSQTVENVTDRVLLNLEGSAWNWNYNTAAYYSSADVDQKFTNGYVNFDRIQSGLNGTAPVSLNPFGPQTVAGQAYLDASKVIGTVQNITGKQWGINGTAGRELFNLPAGPAALALGAEYRKEEVAYKNNFALIRQAVSSGLELANDADGDRNVWALMAELNIPVVKNLDLNLALRHDDYSDVGSTTNPKVSLRFQPVSTLLMRASYNKGFRAPNLYDLHSPSSITNTANRYDDPLLCPGGKPNASLGGQEDRDCGQQFNRQTSGNTQVKPEKSESWSAGFVFDVARDFSFSADYWNTIIKDQVGTLPDSAVFSNQSLYGANFVRCGALPAAEAKAIKACNDGPNVLAYVFTPTENLGNTKASGLDLSAQWRPQAFSFGKLAFQINGTYLLGYKSQLYKDGPYYNALGQYSYELDFPAFRWQHVASLSWQKAEWSANLFNRLKSAYRDQNDVNELGKAYADNKVGAYSVWDLTGTWQGVKGLSVTAGVLNLFNERPSFSNQGSTFQVNFDPRFTNPLDRTYMAKLSYAFK